MRQYRIKRLVQRLALSESNIATVDLPRGYDLESVFLRLSGGLQVTVAGSAVRAESPCQAIARVELVADGKNTIASFPFTLLNQCNVFARSAPIRTPPSNFTIATYQVAAGARLDLASIDGSRPKDSNLRTSGMQLLQLRVTTAAAAACFVGATANFSSLFLDVYTSELVEIADKDGEITQPLFLVKRTYQDVAFTASNTNMEVPLPVGNIMRGVILRGEGAVTAGEPSDSVINNISLRSGVDVRYNLSYLNSREEARQNYGIGALPTGYTVADLMCNGGLEGNRASEGWDLAQASEAKCVLDVTGAANTKVTLGTIELIR